MAKSRPCPEDRSPRRLWRLARAELAFAGGGPCSTALPPPQPGSATEAQTANAAAAAAGNTRRGRGVGRGEVRFIPGAYPPWARNSPI